MNRGIYGRLHSHFLDCIDFILTLRRAPTASFQVSARLVRIFAFAGSWLRTFAIGIFANCRFFCIYLKLSHSYDLVQSFRGCPSRASPIWRLSWRHSTTSSTTTTKSLQHDMRAQSINQGRHSSSMTPLTSSSQVYYNPRQVHRFATCC